MKGCAGHIIDSQSVHGYIRGYETTSKCGARHTDEVQIDDGTATHDTTPYFMITPTYVTTIAQ